MKAQIKSIANVSKNFGRNTYQGLEVTYQAAPWKGKQKDPVTKFIFGNSDVAKDFNGVEVGDWVEITFESVMKNGREFKNPSKVEKTSPPVDSQPQAAASSGGGGNNFYDNRQESIEKQCCLKEAVNLVTSLVAGGGYTAANIKKTEFMVEEVCKVAEQFYQHLTGKAEPDVVDFNEPENNEDFNQEDMND